MKRLKSETETFTPAPNDIRDTVPRLATAIMESCGAVPRPDIQIPGIENLVIEKRQPTKDVKMPGVDFAVSPSALKKFRESVPKFAGIYIFKTIDRDPSTPEMIFGTLLHCMLLEPENLKGRFLGAPECTRQSNAGKERWAACEQEAAQTGRQIVTRDQVIEAVRCADAIMNHARAREVIEQPGQVEVRLDAEDEWTGLKLQRRFDKLLDGGGEVEIKTTANADYEEFGRQAWNLWYHGACAFGKLVLDLNGLSGPQTIIAVDKKTYEVSVNPLASRELQIGMRDVRKYLAELRDRIDREDWSSRLIGEKALTFPYWVYRQAQNGQ